MDSGKNLFLEQLYKLYAEDIFNVAYMKLNYDEEKAREAVQETFSIACMKIDDIYQADYPQAWLFKVVDNVVKREKFRLCTGKTKDGEYKFVKEISIDKLLIEEMVIEKVEFYEDSVFDRLEKILTKREMQFIEERYLKGKKYKEVADILQINESACTSFGNRIHKKIKKILKKRDKTSKNFDI